MTPIMQNGMGQFPPEPASDRVLVRCSTCDAVSFRGQPAPEDEVLHLIVLHAADCPRVARSTQGNPSATDQYLASGAAVHLQHWALDALVRPRSETVSHSRWTPDEMLAYSVLLENDASAVKATFDGRLDLTDIRNNFIRLHRDESERAMQDAQRLAATGDLDEGAFACAIAVSELILSMVCEAGSPRARLTHALSHLDQLVGQRRLTPIDRLDARTLLLSTKAQDPESFNERLDILLALRSRLGGGHA